MSAKFEDLVKAIEQARSLFDLSNLSLGTMQQGFADLEARLQALERKPGEPKPGDD
jgi:hypothetical protein